MMNSEALCFLDFVFCDHTKTVFLKENRECYRCLSPSRTGDRDGIYLFILVEALRFFKVNTFVFVDLYDGLFLHLFYFMFFC